MSCAQPIAARSWCRIPPSRPHKLPPAVGKPTVQPPSTWMGTLSRRHSQDQSAQQRRPPTSHEQCGHGAQQRPRCLRFVGSTSRRRHSSMCCSVTQPSANFMITSASAFGRSLRGPGWGNSWPGSDFLGPLSSGAIVAAVQSLAVSRVTVA